MSPSPERIRTHRHVTAMAALDTIEAIAERVTNLLSHGRHITTARRYVDRDTTPDVKAGLTLAEEPRSYFNGDRGGIGVHLQPGLNGFGIHAYAGESDTEAGCWKRYHSDDRKDLTEVVIEGGLPGDGAARDDQLVIRYWNQYGVCEETVVAFDYSTRVTP